MVAGYQDAHILLVGGAAAHQQISFLISNRADLGESTVDEGFHLRGKIIIVNRRGQHQHVTAQNFIQNRRHIILMHTGSAIFLTDLAAKAEIHLFPPQGNHFHLVSGNLRAPHKFGAELLGVATFSRTR